MQKLHNKDFQIAFKSGSDANKSKFAKECAHGELYLSDDALYVAESSAGVNDSALSKFLPAFGDATIFSTEAALISSIAPAGTAAYANDTGRVYISNGSGWAYYNRDLINNHSLSFDGSNDYLSISGSSALDLSYDLTIMFWFKANSFSNWNYAFSLTTFPSTSASAKMARLLGFYNGKLNSNTYYDGWEDAASTSLQTNTWYHGAVVYERTAGTNSGFHTLYLNGAVDLARTAVNMKDINYVETQIGKSYNSEYFDGLLDEVAVFDSALSASDISSIYNNGTPDFLSSYNPVGWWRMGDDNGGTGTTITDQGSGGNDATLTNGPTFSTDTP